MRTVVGLVAALLIGSRAFAHGVWDTRFGTYHEEMEDLNDIERYQAMELVPSETSMRIPSTWCWVQPDQQAADPPATITRFSQLGSSTTFTWVQPGGGFGERVVLNSFWWDAIEMKDRSKQYFPYVFVPVWQVSCMGGQAFPGSIKACPIFPVPARGTIEEAYGARAQSVLLVPDVSIFTDCKYNIKAMCTGGDAAEKRMVALVLSQGSVNSIIQAGQHYTVTWKIRTDGPHATADVSFFPNDYLLGFNTRFFSGTAQEYMGGSNTQCTPPDLFVGCLDRTTNIGCPVRVMINSPVVNSVTPYYTSTKPSNYYTPYSYSFCAGYMDAYYPYPNPPHCSTCLENRVNKSNLYMCANPPTGFWEFNLSVEGLCDKVAGCASTCPTSAGQMCLQPRAAASAYIDGMQLTVSKGTYDSHVFDSLSPYTRWISVAWDADLNMNSKGPRTPLIMYYGASDSATAVNYAESVTALTDSGANNLATPLVGQYFRYQANMRAWGVNAANPPPKAELGWFGNSCARFNPMHDGGLIPKFKQARVCYIPDAGLMVTRPIRPKNLRWWKRLTYMVSEGGGEVAVDVLDENFNPISDGNGNPILTSVDSGDSLMAVRTGAYPAVRIRFILRKKGDAAADPRVLWFKVEYEPVRETLEVNKNSIRLARNDTVPIRFSTEVTGMVSVEVHDAAGQYVRRLFKGELDATVVQETQWDGRNDGGRQVAPGVYFITAVTPAGRRTSKLAVLR